MKKGFTLVELLAVITILGILALIIAPKVQKTIKDSKKNIYESSAYALSREADNFYLAKKTELTSFDGCTYDFTNNSNTCNGFEFKGQKPDSGTLNIDKNGNVQFSVKFEKYCYVKQKKSDNITVISNCTENIELSEPVIVTSGDGLYESATEPGRLVYRGANPNNYINIKEDGTNNTLYRIVSYEPDGTIKVIRNESIGRIAWDESTGSQTGPRANNDNSFCNYITPYYFGCNVWGNQVNTLYNSVSLGDNFQYNYYGVEPNTLLTSSYSGKVKDNASLNKYLNETWVTSSISNYIENHNFNVGGLYLFAISSIDMGIAKEKKSEKLYTWNGKVGLLSITEYAESSTNSACTDVVSNFRYNTANQTNLTSNEWPCKYENYNYKSEYNQWSITPQTRSTNEVWFMGDNGEFYSYAGATDCGVRPAFYLKSDTLISGTGTQSDPYRILN